MKKLLITSEQLTALSGCHAARYLICALYEGDRMAEAEVHRADGQTILNNIYIARVKDVARHLHAAFVEIAKGKVCFLPLEDLKKPLFTKKVSEKTIAAGDELVVQVAKDAVKTKDPVATTNLSFSGEYVVLTSANCRIGISTKISGQERARLQALGHELLEADSLEETQDAKDSFGIIFRTNAAQAEETAIREEFLRLRAEYEALMAYAASRTVYSCLHKEQPFYLKMLMDADKSGLEEVVTDEKEVWEALKSAETGGVSLRFYEDRLLPLAKLYQAAGQIEAALKTRVWLKSGANIVIEATEALTVIDVNSGKNISQKDKRLNHYKINLEAAQEIAFQLRLRNLSGIIVVDFIDMYDQALDQELMSHLRGFLSKDSVPVKLVDMTKLGLVEITRKKKKKPLAEQLIS